MGLYVSELRSPLHTPEELDALIRTDLVPKLRLPEGIHAFCFLKALTGQESSFGKNDKPRFEPAYAPGGLYYQKNKLLKELYLLYGPLISMSYGAFQMMYPTALQYGFSKALSPLELWDASISGFYVVQYLNDKCAKGAKSLEQLADAYNSGSYADKRLPQVERYIQNFLKIYDEMKNRYG